MGADTLAAPADYPGHWLVLGIVLVAGALAWAGVLVWWPHRRRRVRVAGPLTGSRLERLKAQYLAEIERVEAGARSGAIAVRAAHLELGRLLRAFVSEATGDDVRPLTRDELARTQHAGLTQVVGDLYAPEFAHVTADEASSAARAAAGLVSAWN